MGEKLVVGPIAKGLKTDREPFVIDNDSFPVLTNAYQWRGRIKRKRGTSFLNRLQRYFNSTSTSYSSTSSIILDGSVSQNLLTGFSLQTNGNIIPGTVTIVDLTSGNTFTDNSLGVLTGAPAGAGTINYATGAISFSSGAAAGDLITAVFRYYPDLPVMGIEDLLLTANQFATNLLFDTKYSYNLVPSAPFNVYDVSFYKNPSADPSTLPGYTAKTVVTPTTWNGQDYQQFWTTNYQGALWATNGITVPFTTTNIGMQFKNISEVTMIVAGPPATARLTIANHGLVVGDFLFINEIPSVTVTGINFQTCYVIAVPDANHVDVEFPNATLGGAGGAVSSGIAQYLTNRSDATKDCLRWYDGDPTNGSATAPVLNQTKGWVNFAPPLLSGPTTTFTIADLPVGQYYLVGARMIVPFKDRLLFIGPVVQTSTLSPVYLQDTIIYSQNGTPYYTASFTGSVTSASTQFFPILLPTNQTSTANAYFMDVTGYGGFVTIGAAQPINTAVSNEDVLILGLNSEQIKCVYTGNDILPFTFYTVNSELGSANAFAAVNFDAGALTYGDRGIIIANQNEAVRVDLEIPDQVFQLRLTNNGTQRTTAQRDFINEWVYFTYAVNQNDQQSYRFPTQTLLYNYREQTWGIFDEVYTTYGQFRQLSGYTWATIGQKFATWSVWNEPWKAGSTTLLQPQVLAGNQQGFLLLRDDGTNEGNSLYIRSFSGSQITSPDHCLNVGDFIYISGAIGTISTQVNNQIFQVYSVGVDTFSVYPALSAGTYFGGGLIKRMYRPFIQTKQFPVAWGMSRKTRIGPQQYLLSTTANSQMELQIYLSQNASDSFNSGPIVPQPSENNSLVYADILYTCRESDNIGLTPANINLQQITPGSAQTWHRMNTSLIGDTVQIGFTLSNAQMGSLTASGQASTITAITNANPCVITCANSFSLGQRVIIEDVEGMTDLNGNVYYITVASSSSISINVDSTSFGTYTGGGTVQLVQPIYQFAEIELHGFILDVSPSQVLA